MKRKLVLPMLIMLLSCALAFSASADNVSQIIGNNNTVVFVDVPQSYWARDEILSFASQNIINGTGDKKFSPGAGVTREQFAKMLVLTFHAALTTPDKASFTDVPSDRWSYPYIEVSKDFLTGYSSPFDGSMSFHPEAFATREDIAVALVRMMGLTDKDVEDPNYAKDIFSDADSISPSLLPYVSLAVEKGLLKGYSDGTFGATRHVTRAEAVVLLNRASKQAVTNVEADIEVTTQLVYSKDGKDVTLYINAPQGATVTVDGKSVSMSKQSSYYESGSTYTGVYAYHFDQEGSKTFAVVATKSGKTKNVSVTAKYEIGLPVLTITQCPTSVTSKETTLKGTLTDSKYKVSLTINGESVSVDYNGDWSKTVSLKEGENKFVFVASNSQGKSTKQEKSIQFNMGGPQLVITQCPTSVTSKEATIEGTLTDSNYKVSLTINGESVSVDHYGSWSKTVQLKEGENKLVFVASNSQGKTTRQEKSIQFNMSGPQLTITQCPTSVTSKEATIEGTLTDSNYKVSLTINGESVSVDHYGSWSKTVQLKEGENKLIFVASNAQGKTTTQQKTVIFNVAGPQLTITQCPTSVTSKEATIEGTLTDSNYMVSLTINGESVSVDHYGNWSKTVQLKEGANKLIFVASNAQGKTTTQEKTVVLSVGSPEITLYNCPEMTQERYISLSGKINGSNDGAKLYINDQEVSLDYDLTFSKQVSLSDGDNSFVFRAVNSFGKSTSIVKTIKLTEIKAPELTVNDVPSTSSEKSVTITGTVSDSLDSAVSVSVNDSKAASGSGSWSYTLTLSEGSNDIIVVATNQFGKSTTIVKHITYTPVPDTSTQTTGN